MFSSILNKNPLKCRVVIRLDDIAPNMNWDMMNKTKDFLKFEQFIKKNQRKIITFSEANQIKSNSFFHKTTKYFIEQTLKFKRAFL